MRTERETCFTSGEGGATTARAPGRVAIAALVGVALAGCAPPQAAPPVPDAPGESPPAASAAALSGPRYTEADVRFVQGMLAHHAQALVMTDLVAGRTDTRAVHLLAERIDVSQQDEIRQMESWLRARGAEVPALHAGHGEHAAHHAAMPGMLTAEQLAGLAASEGAAFDRLFLELMIQHHQGALTMVDALFDAPGAGQEVEIYRIASEIAADQQAEIQRMQRLLASLS